MKLFVYSFLFALSVLCLLFLFASRHENHSPKNINRYKLNDQPDSAEKSRIIQKAVIIKKYITGKKLNNKHCFLIDMNLPSGKNRFFVFDLSKDSIVLAGCVAHGHCKKGFCPTAIFSNQEKSCCTALGKYRVGAHYNGQYGLAYKLYGLDSSNSNAYARNIVLHAYSCVPEKETDPVPICNSSGCPMLSPGFLKKLQPYIDKEPQPVVLWIFN